MKPSALFIAVLFAAIARAEPSGLTEDVITRGPHAGQKRVITNTVAFPPEATVLQKEASVSLGLTEARTNLAVALTSRKHTFISQSASGERLPGYECCYEFEIRSVEPGRFLWSCWVGDFPRPHRFEVRTTESGQSYACYIRSGVHVIRLSESRPTEAMRGGFWENPLFELGETDLPLTWEKRERASVRNRPGHPDALPVLWEKQIREALGPDARLYLNATTMYAEVLDLSDREGDLRLTVRGGEPRAQDYHDGKVPEGMRERWLRSRATFALRSGQWVLVSATPQ